MNSIPYNMRNRSRSLAHIQYRLSIARVSNIQELLVTYDKKIEIMGGNINECALLYIYNYSLYCETLKLREKIEYLTKKWNYNASEEIILWNIKMNTYSCLICGFNSTEKLSFTRRVYLWSDKYMECRLYFVNLWMDSHFTRNMYTVSYQKVKKEHNDFKHVVFLSIQKLKMRVCVLNILKLIFVRHSQK